MDYEENQQIAEQHGFAFAACMNCAHKQGCPDSAICKYCIYGEIDENQTIN